MVERAERLAESERALAVREAALADYHEHQAFTGNERHDAIHRRVALLHRGAQLLHQEAAVTHQRHADLHRPPEQAASSPPMAVGS
jgi:hypothetical protein